MFMNVSENKKDNKLSLTTVNLSNDSINTSQIDLEDGENKNSISSNPRIDLINDSSNNNLLCEDNDCIGLLILISAFILTVGLMVSVVCYYIFGIKFLVEDKDKNDRCNSEIWNFVLTCIVMSSVISTLSISLNSKEDLKLIVSIFGCLIFFGVGIWGLDLCLNENCDEMKDSDLFNFAYVVSILNIIAGGIVILGMIFGFLGAYSNNK